MYDVMRFWLDRGVDGLRVDVLWMLIKDDQFRDNPTNPDWREGDFPWARQIRLYSEDRPEIHEVVREMRAVMDSYAERLLIGEIYLPLPRLMRYYGDTLNGVHFPCNFQLALLSAQLSLTRVLLTLRRAKPALNSGSYHALESRPENCFVYLREHGEQRLLVALNFSAEAQVVMLPEFGAGRILISTHLDREEQVNLAALSLRSHEGCIIEIAASA